MNQIKLNTRGVLFSELAEFERTEIKNQFNINGIHPIFSDPQFEKYRFLKSEKHGWVITNANNLPLETKRMRV